MKYFVLRCGEDGMSVAEYNRDELEKALTVDEYGETHFGRDPVFLGAAPKTDRGYFLNVPEKAVLVIEGKIIVPKPAKAVLQYRLD